jgi:hypothetical protein
VGIALAFATVYREINGKSLSPQPASNELGELAIIFDHEYSQRNFLNGISQRSH